MNHRSRDEDELYQVEADQDRPVQPPAIRAYARVAARILHRKGAVDDDGPTVDAAA